jgi:hypothetical protein
MPHIHHTSSKAAAAVLILVLAAFALTACGSSSKGSSSTGTTTTSASASVPAASGARGAIAGRFAAVRECLQKNGITLPKRTPGQRPSPGAVGFPGGPTAPSLPQGMTRAQYDAILKKCGGGFLGGGLRHGLPGIGSRLRSPAITKALTKFATCMRENGVPVPAPNTSGKGPIFDTKGLNIHSPTFRAAETKCRSSLSTAFHASPGTAGAGG